MWREFSPLRSKNSLFSPTGERRQMPFGLPTRNGFPFALQPGLLLCLRFLPASPINRSQLTTSVSPSQGTYPLRRAFSFSCKAHRALILLLLAAAAALLQVRGWMLCSRGSGLMSGESSPFEPTQCVGSAPAAKMEIPWKGNRRFQPCCRSGSGEKGMAFIVVPKGGKPWLFRFFGKGRLYRRFFFFLCKNFCEKDGIGSTNMV